MHHALILASRVAATIVAIVAFYFAFFLYEDEEGVWQNRIENLWNAVYDRAKVTDRTSTALFNKIGEALNNGLNHLFGKRLWSMQSMAVSINLSLAGALIFAGFYNTHYRNFPIFSRRSLGLFLVTCFCCLLTLLAIRLGGRWRYIAGLPIFYVLLLSVTTASFAFMTRSIPNGNHFVETIEALPIIFFLSLLIDYVAVTMIRKTFYFLSSSVSVERIVAALFALTCFSMLIVGGPIYTDRWAKLNRPQFYPLGSFWGLGVAGMNISTAMICLIPASMLLLVLFHRLMWPMLSRLLYPLASRSVITNKKALVSLASVCLIYALNLEHVGIKELLKLLS